MKVAIIGAGFTGLTAGLRLAQKGHTVHIFEKEDAVGGMAAGFKKPEWDWPLEKSYHHWFTNDERILTLAKELHQKIITKRPHTDIFINNEILPFDSPLSLLTFPYLPLSSRIKIGLTLAYLKLINNYKRFEDKIALQWIKQWTGEEATKLIWDPLFSGKFGNCKNMISLSWLWARIKKRTTSLTYPEKGIKTFTEKITEEIENLGGKILLEHEVKSISSLNKRCIIKTKQGSFAFDKIICTSPSSIFTKVTPNLPQNYIKKINLIPHLHALNMTLILKKPLLKNTYWLNITEKDFPFLVLVEHTNFMDPIHYNNQHIVYIGNYLPPDHPFLKMTKNELLNTYSKYLLKIDPNFRKNLITFYKFINPFAQPVVGLKHSLLIPRFETPLKNVYLANLDMVYPWDRGTNYAVELGEKIAKLID